MKIDIGISEENRKKLSQELAHLLADTYATYHKTHAYHWNVTGPMFTTLHELFEQQYTELWQAVDEIAERIRALGHYAPGGYSTLSNLSGVAEDDGVAPARQMLQTLVGDHETIVRTARKLAETASDVGDEPTADLCIQRIQVSEKTAWMLRSLLQED